MEQNQTVVYRDLGLIRYAEAWDLQEAWLREIVERKRANRTDPEHAVTTQSLLLFCEHPHVYTLGKSGKPEHLLLTPPELEARGIDYHKINRGGDITYHGPGQIVGYPIIDLDHFRTDIGWYLRNLEEACILTLQEYGLESGRIEGLTGVWMGIGTDDPRKIMAIGVRCSLWVTMHGFAFNINSDLGYFANIIPCGIDDKGVTSLDKELGRPVPMEEAKEKMRANLARVFGWTEIPDPESVTAG